MPLSEDSAAEVREIARQEVSSLCGLILRRLQDAGVRDPENDHTFVRVSDLNSIFGEALEQFS